MKRRMERKTTNMKASVRTSFDAKSESMKILSATGSDKLTKSMSVLLDKLDTN